MTEITLKIAERHPLLFVHRKESGNPLAFPTFEDRVVVSWRDSSQIEIGYVVYREDTATSIVDTLGQKGPNITSLVDLSGTPGANYLYYVAAYDTANSFGTSPHGKDHGLRDLFAPTSVEAGDRMFENRRNRYRTITKA